MSADDIIDVFGRHVIPNYTRVPLVVARGEGSWLWDADGKKYLDLFPGWGVSGVGHCHPRVVEAVREQAGKLFHVANNYYSEPQGRFAEILANRADGQQSFFCNSGAEAAEGAIKLARLHGHPRYKIITFEGSFHGRTFGAITATGQPKYHEGFAPLFPGITHVPFNDVAALEEAIAPDTGAVLLEPIQGEGGVRVPADDYLGQVRALCDDKKVLLILDEVQTGLGRTGKLFAHEHAGITPDIMTLAKGLANGVPIGAMGCTEDVASGFGVGSHACTFGGNPLSSAAAVATLKTLLTPGFIEHAAETGAYLFSKLEPLASKFSHVVEVRGKGLMVGIEMEEAVAPVIEKMLDAGIICGPAGPKVLRFLPPLIITNDDVDRVVAALTTALESL